jgi:hypothetical protein
VALDTRRPGSTVDRHCALLFADLRDAHATLLEAMAQLDELTDGHLPHRGRVVEARWNISSASLARRTLWSRILAHLSTSAFREHDANLRVLQETDMALLRFSCAHIATWSIDAVMKDWASYCPASRAMRQKMKAAIETEKRLLYPMLGG